MVQKTDHRVWFFGTNPNNYNIGEELSSLHPGDHEAWSIRQHRSEIHVGDTVLLWQTGRHAGIYATAIVSSEPYEQYWNVTDEEVKERPYARTKYWVDLRLTRILDTPITRQSLREHPILRDLQILRAPVGTNFPITREQWTELEKLLPPRQGFSVPVAIDLGELGRLMRPLHDANDSIIHERERMEGDLQDEVHSHDVAIALDTVDLRVDTIDAILRAALRCTSPAARELPWVLLTYAGQQLSAARDHHAAARRLLREAGAVPDVTKAALHAIHCLLVAAINIHMFWKVGVEIEKDIALGPDALIPRLEGPVVTPNRQEGLDERWLVRYRGDEFGFQVEREGAGEFRVFVDYVFDGPSCALHPSREEACAAAVAFVVKSLAGQHRVYLEQQVPLLEQVLASGEPIAETTRSWSRTTTYRLMGGRLMEVTDWWGGSWGDTSVRESVARHVSDAGGVVDSIGEDADPTGYESRGVKLVLPRLIRGE